MAAIGLHFLDQHKLWDRAGAAGRAVPLVDVAWCVQPWTGFDVVTSRTRLAADCDLLWSAGVRDIHPYLRVDYQPGLTLADRAEYYAGVLDAMRWWTSVPRARLTIICGNEPNLLAEGTVFPATVAACVAGVVARRDAAGLPRRVRVFAPAVGPWAPTNVADRADFYPDPLGRPSSEWKNFQYGIARRLQGVALDGYALHAYSRDTAKYGTAEPRTDYLGFGARQAQMGFRWYREAINAISLGDGRALDLAITEANSDAGRPSRDSYVPGLLAAMADEVSGVPRVRDLCWYVGRAHSVEQAVNSTEQRTPPMMPAADDDFNRLVLG